MNKKTLDDRQSISHWMILLLHPTLRRQVLFHYNFTILYSSLLLITNADALSHFLVRCLLCFRGVYIVSLSVILLKCLLCLKQFIFEHDMQKEENEMWGYDDIAVTWFYWLNITSIFNDLSQFDCFFTCFLFLPFFFRLGKKMSSKF